MQQIRQFGRHHRQAGLDRLRWLTWAAAAVSAFGVAFFGALAATTIPGHAASGKAASAATSDSSAGTGTSSDGSSSFWGSGSSAPQPAGGGGGITISGGS